MTRSEAGRLGGIITAKKLRQQAIEKYYADPNYCKNCDKVIEVGEKESVSHTREKRFCNHSCSAQFNNLGSCKNRDGNNGTRTPSSKNTGKWVSKNAKSYVCKYCNTEFVVERVKKKIAKRQICDRCSRLRLYVPSRDESETLQELMGRLGVETMSDQRLRSVIVTHARRTYRRNDKKFVCEICGYDKHANVCHIQPWTKFPKTASLGEINNIDNLIALCPNHHWEFDHNLLDDTDKARVAQRTRATLLYGEGWGFKSSHGLQRTTSSTG